MSFLNPVYGINQSQLALELFPSVVIGYPFFGALRITFEQSSQLPNGQSEAVHARSLFPNAPTIRELGF